MRHIQSIFVILSICSLSNAFTINCDLFSKNHGKVKTFNFSKNGQHESIKLPNTGDKDYYFLQCDYINNGNRTSVKRSGAGLDCKISRYIEIEDGYVWDEGQVGMEDTTLPFMTKFQLRGEPFTFECAEKK